MSQDRNPELLEDGVTVVDVVTVIVKPVHTFQGVRRIMWIVAFVVTTIALTVCIILAMPKPQVSSDTNVYASNMTQNETSSMVSASPFPSRFKRGTHLEAPGQADDDTRYYEDTHDKLERLTNEMLDRAFVNQATMSEPQAEVDFEPISAAFLSVLTKTPEEGEDTRLFLHFMNDIFEQAGGLQTIQRVKANLTKVINILDNYIQTTEADVNYAMDIISSCDNGLNSIKKVSVYLLMYGTESQAQVYKAEVAKNERLYWDIISKMGTVVTLLGNTIRVSRANLDELLKFYDQIDAFEKLAEQNDFETDYEAISFLQSIFKWSYFLSIRLPTMEFI